MSEPENDDADEYAEKPEAPAPKKRLAPKLGIRGQIAFVMSLIQRAKMSDGSIPKEAWLLLEPIDLERLDDLAAGLDGILLAEEIKKSKKRY